MHGVIANVGGSGPNLGLGAELGILLLVATLVALITQRVRVPYSVGLVIAGAGLALVNGRIIPPLTRDLIFLVFLPPLIFEAAIQIPWRRLRRELPVLVVLVSAGVGIAAAVVAGGMHWALGWSWLGAGLFGLLIAATDPVAVIAAFKQLGVQQRLHLLVEAESLLNDGTAAVGFSVLAGFATGSAPSGAGGIGLELVRTVAGGIGFGALVAVPLVLLVRRTRDRLVELTVGWLIAYGSFLLADHFEMSGVLATLTAGMIVGNWGFGGSITTEGRRSTLAHWEFVAFLVNSVIFLTIGGHEVHVPIAAIAAAAALAVALALAGRAAAVYLLMAPFARSRLAVPLAYQHVLFWGGLRGALALALALALPSSIAERDEIIPVAFAVVAFSIVVQGLTMPWLIRWLGLRKEA